MKRNKKHTVKTEVPETSTSYNREQEAHDLAYYIHDRVELMHQVFSAIKYKELKAMVPASIRNISLNDLQELCTEELLGISSKRLCAILDGGEPPSDTESSSPSPTPEQMETISLDSISSDDEILSQTSSKKKKHKHRRHSKSKSKRKKCADTGEVDRSKASRAGLTVLELLELQARARAIRAQLQQEQQELQPKPVSDPTSKKTPHSSDNEVEIKEEPAEVVEISSDEEKPKVEELQKKLAEEVVAASQPSSQPLPQPAETKITKDLVIIIPHKPKQKIKLNRNKKVTKTDENTSVTTTQKTIHTPAVPATIIVKPTDSKNDKNKISKKVKTKKKKKDKKPVTKDDIDNDEITLQLSDTEKMDLLEDLDRKHYDSVSSDSSSESCSNSDLFVKEKDNNTGLKDEDNVTAGKGNDDKLTLAAEQVDLRAENGSDSDGNKDKGTGAKASSELVVEDVKNTGSKSSDGDIIECNEEKMESDSTVVNIEKSESIEINFETESEIVDSNDKDLQSTLKDTEAGSKGHFEGAINDNLVATTDDAPALATGDKDTKNAKYIHKQMSEGELTDHESSEIEAVELKPEVVCISDEEVGKKLQKKKKKKEKKSKKDKDRKSKKSDIKSDFRESADQNFYKESGEINENCSQKEMQESIEVIDNTTLSGAPSKSSPITKTIDNVLTIDEVDKNIGNVRTVIVDKVDLTAQKTIEQDIRRVKGGENTRTESPAALSDGDIEAVYEIMELSDDSSCCEVECTTLLSKEPTASEIQALSAKIDEIERDDIITDKEIRDFEIGTEKEDLEEIEHVSWRARYLDSKKVKKILTTSNILNAMRKKNKELKKKLAESNKDKEEAKEKAKAEERKESEEKDAQNVQEEGSIEHYNTLETLTTYVAPVKDVPKDLKKDAKLLLKMYKKLLKYNDINKPDSSHKKRKKKKIKKDKVKTGEEKDTADAVNMENKEVSGNVGEEFRNAVNIQDVLVNKDNI